MGLSPDRYKDNETEVKPQLTRSRFIDILVAGGIVALAGSVIDPLTSTDTEVVGVESKTSKPGINQAENIPEINEYQCLDNKQISNNLLNCPTEK